MRVPAARVVFSESDRARILSLVDESLRSGSLTLGANGAAFEEAFAEGHGRPHAVATSSGTSALEIIFRCLGVAGGEGGAGSEVGVAGREVVVPANTFFASAAAVLHAGGRPRLADVSASTLTVTAESVAAALTPATAAVLVVHIGGLIAPDIDEIVRLCERRGVTLVEDAAHAHGSSWAGRPAGSFGRAAAFSFYPTKVVASAEGGMILTADSALAGEARIYRDQGKDGFVGGRHVRLGAAWRMSELHAAVGRVHLDRLGEFVERRNAVAARYDAAFAASADLTPRPTPPGAVSNVYKYPALLAPGLDRARFKAYLRDRFDVSCAGEVYATPLHHEPVFAGIDQPAAAGPGTPLAVAEDVCARQVCLPVHSDMHPDEVDHVIGAVHAVLADGSWR